MKEAKVNNDFVVQDGVINFQIQRFEQLLMQNQQGNCEGDWGSLELEDQNFQGSEPQSSRISTQPSELNQTTHGRTVPLTGRLSNIDFKKTYGPLRKYRRINKLSKNPYEKTHYGNKSYFFLTIQFLERIGCNLEEVFDFYMNQVEVLREGEQGSNQLSKSVKEYYGIAIRAFELYLSGDKFQAFKTFYKYEKMKLKHNFNKAYNFFKAQAKRRY